MKAMKKILSFIMVVCIAFIGAFTMPMVSAKAETTTVTDTLNGEFAGVASTSYTAWSDKTGTSGAVYAGYSASVKAKTYIQFNDTKKAGIIATKSGGKAKKIIVAWNTAKTTSGRTLDIYGKGTAYTATSDLYGTDDLKGTNLGSIVCGTSTELTISGDYTYIGLRSKSGAMYLTSISIVWEQEQSSEPSTPAPSLSIISGGKNYTEVGKTLDLTAKKENTEEAVVWSSSNDSIATVDNGVIKGVAIGTATITASLETTTSVKATQEIKVYPAEKSVLTIAEAIAVCALTGETNSPFNNYSTTGVIQSIDTKYSEKYDNITVTITDGTNSIKAFQMTGGSDLQVGDKITVTGALVNYKGNTPEFAAGCTYVVDADANATLNTIKTELNSVNAYMSLAYAYTQETTEREIFTTGDAVATFDFGENGATGHKDGSAPDTYTETQNDYVLELNSMNKVYTNAFDETGNSCIKLGTGSAVGSFSFTVPDDVKKVTIAVAGYKNNTVTVTVNKTSYEINEEYYSDNGSYLNIEVDTSFNKTVEFATTTTGYRAMINSITWKQGVPTGETETVVELKDSQFRIRCGVDESLLAIQGIAGYGIQITAGGNTVNYTTDATSWTVEGGKAYVVIDLGDDVINDLAKLSTEFTVTAYVTYKYDDVIVKSTMSKTHSVVSMVKEYKTLGYDVDHLYNYLLGKGVIVEEVE